MHTELQNLLTRQRRRLRSVLKWELLFRILSALAVLFWLGLLLDWSLEPPPAVRQIGYFIAGLTVLLWVARTTLEPLLRPVNDRQIATLVERRHPEYADALITAVDLASRRQAATGVNPELARATADRAARVLGTLGEPRVISARRASKWGALAAIGVATVAAFAFLCSEAMSNYARRLALSPAPWPRRVQLEIEGFKLGDDGVWRRKVARGDSVPLRVHAVLTGGHESPEEVTARYRFEGGVRGKATFAKIGAPSAGEDRLQLFSHTLEEVRSNVTLSIRGGDGRIGPLEVTVAKRPVVTSIECEVTPPAYLNLPTTRVPASAASGWPEGSRFVAHVRTSKPITAASAISLGDQSPIEVGVQPGASLFTVTPPPLTEDLVALIRFTDDDGIESAEPHPLPVSVHPDTLPAITLRLVGVGPIVTPDARIVLECDVKDDYQIGSAQIDLSVDDRQEAPVRLDEAAGKQQASAEIELDLLTRRFATGRDAGRLEPGQQLTVFGSATDLYDLREQDRTSTSQRFTFEVVTADQLLALIEEREVNLRQTFEQTTAEMRRVQARIAGLKLSDQARRIGRVVDGVSKTQQETLAIADSFEKIYLELVYNRISNVDLLNRIDVFIALPLQEIGKEDLPTLRRTLRLWKKGGDESLNPESMAADAAKIVATMEQVLQQMRALETYNEVLAMLRSVIDDQQRVRRATQRARKEQVRSLLLD